ncbi:MAG: hypothetical protein D6828_05065, partial [Nitrospirae bacterium]
IYPFKLTRVVLPVDPENGEVLPMKLSVYYKSGDVSDAIKKACQELGRPWSGKWEKKEITLYTQINHSVSNKGRACNECHSKEGVMDFKSLGYPDDMVNYLRKEK